jgi:glycosyltransferase involved in cell wall biosynthesis
MGTKISIIIPLYNRAQLIEETLRSVINQTFTDWECIVVDDGSTDGSADVVRTMSKQDARIRLIERNRLPKGAPTCRNIGLTYARGEHIIFLDSDDVMSPSCLSNRLEEIKKSPDKDFWVFQTVLFNYQPGDWNIVPNLLSKPGRDDIERFLEVDYPWNICGPIIAKKFLDKNQISFNESLACHQDIDFYIKALLSQANYKKIDAQPDIYIRDANADKISKKAFKRQHLDSKVLLLDTLYSLFEQKNILRAYENKLFKLSLYFAFCIIEANYKQGYHHLISLMSKRLKRSYWRTYIDFYIYYNQRAYNSLNLMWKVIRKIYTIFGLIPDLEDTAPYRSTLGVYSLEEYYKIVGSARE